MVTQAGYTRSHLADLYHTTAVSLCCCWLKFLSVQFVKCNHWTADINDIMFQQSPWIFLTSLGTERHYTVSQSVALSMVTALTTTQRSVTHDFLRYINILTYLLTYLQLDYGGGTLAGIPRHLMNRLQSVMNATAHLVYNHGSTTMSHICFERS